VDQGVAVRKGRGKSGLHRVLGLVTPGRGDPTESATENKPPMAGQWKHGADQVRVKRWGKSPPPDWQQDGHGKPPREQDQIGRRTAQAARVDPTEPAGRSHEVAGDIHPRGMTLHDRTRLTDPPRPPRGGRAYVVRGFPSQRMRCEDLGARCAHTPRTPAQSPGGAVRLLEVLYGHALFLKSTFG